MTGDQISPDNYLYVFSWLFSELEKVNSIALSASDLRCWISNELEVPEEKIAHKEQQCRARGERKRSGFCLLLSVAQ